MTFMIPEKLRVLCIGAHPDDCEVFCGGMAAKWCDRGNEVTLLSVTNGQSGHHVLTGSELVELRAGEAQRATEVIGAISRILPLPDGHLEPSLENRLLLIREIRRIAPHVIVTNRPNDYHPDHRYTSQMVQDAAYSLMVPGIAPDVPAMSFNPAIFYWYDRFRFPAPFVPDVVVAIDAVFDRKLEMLHCHESQFYQWLPWIAGELDEVPATDAERREWVRRFYSRQFDASVAESYREALAIRYGAAGKSVRNAEAYSLCEYGSRLSPEQIERIFFAE